MRSRVGCPANPAKRFLAVRGETGTLLIAAPQHIGTLEAIRAAC